MDSPQHQASGIRVGAVAIGRNEGERLRRCLESLVMHCDPVVYVDSGSTDESVALAEALGVHVVALDMSRPFTAARARNAGFERLMELDSAGASPSELVQFVDGDCEVVSGWLAEATGYLADHPEVAVVCGRRRERYPEQTVFNRLCDIEWDTPIGDARACGGDALMRVSAFREVDGFDPTLIAGEEPELCVRLRQRGHRIVRLDAEMTLHDAAMTHVGQWWKRSVRAGHAFAEGAALHGAPPERHWVRETQRALVYGALLPATAAALSVPSLGLSLGLLAAYPVSASRAFRGASQAGRPPGDAFAWAVACTAAKFPEAQGVLRYHWGRLRRRRATLIEYK
ncbi:MAG: glycosyltransferase [Myxococcota bacterium]